MPSCSELRARARATLGGNIFKNEWLFALLIMLVISTINGILAFTFIGTLLAYGILACGSAAYFSARVRGSIKGDNFEAALDGAKRDIAGSMVLGLLYNVFILLWSLLFIVPGIVKSYSYAMTFYIKNEHPEYTAEQAITESRRMMKGYKGKLFCLHLSFIGWWIVGALCCGIGVLWVQPYVEAANAHFYEELKAGASTFRASYEDKTEI